MGQALARDLRQLIEGLPLLVWTCGPDGQCDYLSSQWIAYTGIPESEQLGSGWSQQLHPDDLERTFRLWGLAVGGGAPFDTEFRIRRHDGTYRWFATRASPLRDLEGNIVKWVGSNTDIHDRKMLEKALSERSAALEASNAELEQFAFVASHDLQEPLRTVTSYVQLIERRYGAVLDVKGRGYVEHVVAGAKRMQALIGDLLACARATLKPDDDVVCDGDAALEASLALLAELIRDSGAIVERGPLGRVRIGEAALMRILQNLVANAIHYRSERVPRIEIASRREGDDVIVSVRDNGVGIAVEHHKRVFQMFQRLQERSGPPGTGVGLALCRRLADAAGGEIWVDSSPGSGSTFFVRLRAAAKDAPP